MSAYLLLAYLKRVVRCIPEHSTTTYCATAAKAFAVSPTIETYASNAPWLCTCACSGPCVSAVANDPNFDGKKGQHKGKEKKRKEHIYLDVSESLSVLKRKGAPSAGFAQRMVAGANGSPMWFKEPRFRLLNKCSCIENVEKYFCALAVFVRQFKSFRKLARDLLPLHRMQRRSIMGDWQWLSSLSILR